VDGGEDDWTNTKIKIDLPGMEKALAAAKEYADEILRPSLKELGGILSDTMGF
jgi:hypothetical protein